jgi:opine dehydrogenase
VPSAGGGALAFKRTLGLAFDDDTYTIGETSTLPYAVRLVEPAEIHVFLKLQAGLFVAGLPQHDTEALRSTLHEVYPSVEPAGASGRPRCRTATR